MRFIWRLGAIFLCYILAAFVMCLVFLISGSAMEFHAPKTLFTHEGLVFLAAGTYAAATYSALPAIPMIVASQLLRTQRWRYFVLGGAIVGAFVFFTLMQPTMGQLMQHLSMLFILIVAGALSGAFYRLIAGRLLPND